MGLNTDSDSEFQLFCRCKTLQNLNYEDLKLLFSLSRKMRLNPGEILLREGDRGEALYFLLEGTLRVQKSGEFESEDYSLEKVVPGEIVGELSFIDGSLRSASVFAETEAKIRSIPFGDLEQFANQSSAHSRIYVNLSKNISQRLRATNEREVTEFRTRIRMGVFLIYIITLLCLFTYSFSGLQELNKWVTRSSYVTLPLTLVLGSFLLGLMKHSRLSWKEFGITLANWKQAVKDGFLLPLPVIAVGMGLHWVWTEFGAPRFGAHLFDGIMLNQSPDPVSWHDWLTLHLAYWFIIAPIQELCTRGGLQELLSNFLIGRHRVFMSILLSNLIFSTIHIYFSLSLGLIVFFGGLYIGWIYSRTHNLISSCIAHALLGSWALSLLGL